LERFALFSNGSSGDPGRAPWVATPIDTLATVSRRCLAHFIWMIQKALETPDQ